MLAIIIIVINSGTEIDTLPHHLLTEVPTVPHRTGVIGVTEAWGLCFWTLRDPLLPSFP